MAVQRAEVGCSPALISPFSILNTTFPKVFQHRVGQAGHQRQNSCLPCPSGTSACTGGISSLRWSFGGQAEEEGGDLPPILFCSFLLLVNRYHRGWGGLSDASRVCSAASTSGSVWPHIVFGWLSLSLSKFLYFFWFNFFFSVAL